tara:strand:+ start:566 stop:979 length:414 start_codon:yes stop_codon:yes gene_type:complete
MAKRHVDNTSLNRNTATRRSKFVSKTKTLPGSESVWEGRNESIVDRINGNMINAKFNKSVKSSKQRRPLPKTHVTNKDYFKHNVHSKWFNKETDFGPGNSYRGHSDSKNRTIYGEDFKVQETIYGKKLVRNNVKTKR